MRFWLVALLAMVAAHGASGADPAWQRLAKDGLAAYDAGDRSGALTRFAGAIAEPTFASAPGEQQRAVLFMAGTAAEEIEHWPDALHYFRAATALPERTSQDFLHALLAAHELKDPRSAIEALTGLARFDPKSFRELGEVAVFQSFRDARDLLPGDPSRFALLDAAFDAHYRSNNGEPPGWVWIDLAALLLERGNRAKAELVIGEIEDPSDLVDVRADLRFVAIVDAHPERFDVVAAVRQRVERLFSEARAKPRSLEAVYFLASALRSAGRAVEALTLLDATISRAASPREFVDRDDWLSWARNLRADVLWKLGRWQEAIEELQRSAGLPEYGGANTSNVINLAERYCQLGQPAQALKTLARIGPASPYGRMEAEMTRAQAADALGDAATVAASLTYLRDHEADGPRLLEETLVTLGRFDEAAKVLIGELDDPIFRIEAMHAMQEFDEGKEPPWAITQRSTWKKMLARDDVKAAIARHGRIEHYLLPRQ